MSVWDVVLAISPVLVVCLLMGVLFALSPPWRGFGRFLVRWIAGSVGTVFVLAWLLLGLWLNSPLLAISPFLIYLAWVAWGSWRARRRLG